MTEKELRKLNRYELLESTVYCQRTVGFPAQSCLLISTSWKSETLFESPSLIGR